MIVGTALAIVMTLSGCGSTQQFAAIPPDVNITTVPNQTIEITAVRYRVGPEIVHVKVGTLGTIDFYAAKAGEYDFKCSHFCGIGHLGMTGKIIVE